MNIDDCGLSFLVVITLTPYKIIPIIIYDEQDD